MVSSQMIILAAPTAIAIVFLMRKQHDVNIRIFSVRPFPAGECCNRKCNVMRQQPWYRGPGGGAAAAGIVLAKPGSCFARGHNIKCMWHLEAGELYIGGQVLCDTLTMSHMMCPLYTCRKTFESPTFACGGRLKYDPLDTKQYPFDTLLLLLRGASVIWHTVHNVITILKNIKKTWNIFLGSSVQ